MVKKTRKYRTRRGGGVGSSKSLKHKGTKSRVRKSTRSRGSKKKTRSKKRGGTMGWVETAMNRQVENQQKDLYPGWVETAMKRQVENQQKDLYPEVKLYREGLIKLYESWAKGPDATILACKKIQRSLGIGLTQYKFKTYGCKWQITKQAITDCRRDKIEVLIEIRQLLMRKQTWYEIDSSNDKEREAAQIIDDTLEAVNKKINKHEKMEAKLEAIHDFTDYVDKDYDREHDGSYEF